MDAVALEEEEGDSLTVNPSATQFDRIGPAGEDEQEIVSGDESEQSTPASQVYWSVKAILQEKRGKYLLAWEGTDTSTGKDYRPTWEPYSAVTQPLIDAWNAQKQLQKAKNRRTSSNNNNSSVAASRVSLPTSRRARASSSVSTIRAPKAPAGSYEPLSSSSSPDEVQIVRKSPVKHVYSSTRKSLPAVNSDSSDDEEANDLQRKLVRFKTLELMKAARQNQGKGKGKALVIESNEEDEDEDEEEKEGPGVVVEVVVEAEASEEEEVVEEKTSSIETIVPDSQSQGAVLKFSPEDMDADEEENGQDTVLPESSPLSEPDTEPEDSDEDLAITAVVQMSSIKMAEVTTRAAEVDSESSSSASPAAEAIASMSESDFSQVPVVDPARIVSAAADRILHPLPFDRPDAPLSAPSKPFTSAGNIHRRPHLTATLQKVPTIRPAALYPTALAPTSTRAPINPQSRKLKKLRKSQTTVHSDDIQNPDSSQSVVIVSALTRTGSGNTLATSQPLQESNSQDSNSTVSSGSGKGKKVVLKVVRVKKPLDMISSGFAGLTKAVKKKDRKSELAGIKMRTGGSGSFRKDPFRPDLMSGRGVGSSGGIRTGGSGGGSGAGTVSARISTRSRIPSSEDEDDGTVLSRTTLSRPATFAPWTSGFSFGFAIPEPTLEGTAEVAPLSKPESIAEDELFTQFFDFGGAGDIIMSETQDTNGSNDSTAPAVDAESGGDGNRASGSGNSNGGGSPYTYSSTGSAPTSNNYGNREASNGSHARSAPSGTLSSLMGGEGGLGGHSNGTSGNDFSSSTFDWTVYQADAPKAQEWPHSEIPSGGGANSGSFSDARGGSILSPVPPAPKRVLELEADDRMASTKKARATPPANFEPSVPGATHVPDRHLPTRLPGMAYSPFHSDQPIRSPPLSLQSGHTPSVLLPSIARVQSRSPYHPIPGLPSLNPATPARVRSPSPAPIPSNSTVLKPAPSAVMPFSVSSPSPNLPLLVQSPSSRNASPAPGANLGELIKNSKAICDTDSTKEELVKFVGDPAAYTANPGQNLYQRISWAFELRRTSEKADILIIRMDTCNYQLKRTLVSVVPTLDVAWSIWDPIPTSQSANPSRAGTPIRASTPAAPPRALTPAQPPAPVAAPTLPSAAFMSREQLEQEYTSLFSRHNGQTAELAHLRATVAELPKLRADNATLTTSNKRLQAQKESAASDANYLKDRYNDASNAARDRANEATVAEASVSRLERLLDIGMKQRDELIRGIEKRSKEVIERLQNDLEMVKEQSRRSDGQEIRRKASQWDDYCETKKAASERQNLDWQAEEVEERVAEEAFSIAAEAQDQAAALIRSQEKSKALVSAMSIDHVGEGEGEEGFSPESSDPLVFKCLIKQAPDDDCAALLPSREALGEHVQMHYLTPTSSAA